MTSGRGDKFWRAENQIKGLHSPIVTMADGLEAAVQNESQTNGNPAQYQVSQQLRDSDVVEVDCCDQGQQKVAVQERPRGKSKTRGAAYLAGSEGLLLRIGEATATRTRGTGAEHVVDGR